jgi:hypothetical protein
MSTRTDFPGVYPLTTRDYLRVELARRRIAQLRRLLSNYRGDRHDVFYRKMKRILCG